MTAEGQLASLPEPLQIGLLKIIRLVIGMDASEKEDASIYCHALSHANNPEDSTVLLLHAVESLLVDASAAANGA